MKLSDFVDFRSIRMKVILLIVFWAGVMLTGQLANGILSAMNTGDAELLHQVATLRSLPQNMSRDAIGIIQNAEDVSHFPTLRIAIKGYSETLSKFEPSIEKGSNPKTLLFPRDALRQKLMESKLEERRIRRAVEQLKDEWEKHRPLFEGVMSDEERPEIVAINDAVDDLIIQSDRLSSVINLTVNERLTFINWINLAVIICGLFAAGLVFRTLHRIILIPLENLKNATARFADNDMTARATIFNENDEIGVLSRIFNTMVETVAERERIDKERLAEIRNMNEELQHASKMKSHFLATMSHELRTPMNSIIGYSDLLLDGIDGELNPDQTEDVQSVLRSAEHLLTLINDVLDLSKIEAGHMKVDLSEIRIQDAVQEVMDQVSPILKEKKLLSEVKYIDENVVVLADYDRLRQILLNLISNALKFTDTGSITVRVMKDDEFGIFSVEDTGVGVPEEYLKSIFEEFQQVDGATTRKHGGTGLGLTIVRRLVELMDGTVSVSSQLGSGSIFHVKLPLAHPREMRDSVKEKPMAGILLVDDDPETIALFGRYLAKERIGIIAARSVAEAKRILEEALEEKNEKTEIAAVLLDLHLPDASGYDLLKFMKQSEDWKNTPVAIVTIADDNGTSVKNGASTHMVKPINRAELLKMVNTLLAESERIKAND